MVHEQASRQVGSVRQRTVGMPVPLCCQPSGTKRNKAVNHHPPESVKVEDNSPPVARTRIFVGGKNTIPPRQRVVARAAKSDAVGRGADRTGPLLRRPVVEQKDIVRGGPREIITPRPWRVGVTTIVHEKLATSDGKNECEMVRVIMVSPPGTGVEKTPFPIRLVSKHSLPGPREMHRIGRGSPGQHRCVSAKKAFVGLPVGVVVERVKTGGRGQFPDVDPEAFDTGRPDGNQVIAAGRSKCFEQLLVIQGDDALVMAGEFFVSTIRIHLFTVCPIKAFKTVGKPTGGKRVTRHADRETHESQHFGHEVITV